MSSILDALRKSEKKQSQPLDPRERGTNGKRSGRSGGQSLLPWVLVTLLVCVVVFLVGAFALFQIGWLSLGQSAPEVPVQSVPAGAVDPGLIPPPVAWDKATPTPTHTNVPEPTATDTPPVPTPSPRPTVAIPTVTATPGLFPEPGVGLEGVSEQGVSLSGENAQNERLLRRKKLKLNGIMYDERRPMAIINGNLVGIGDRVGGYRVKAIERDGVKMEGLDQPLRLNEE